MMQEIPLVSIITVTFNLIKAGREKYFRQCLESVHNQTYKNIEHIIIDGASNDGTVDLTKKYADKGWIKYISEQDNGIYDALNKGVKLASGKFIAFLNSDDYYHNNIGVEASVKALEKSNADFSYAPVLDFDEPNNFKKVTYPKISNVFFTIIPNHQTMFVKKSAIIKEGMFNTHYKCVADYDLTVRLCLKKYKSVYVKDIFTTYRWGGFSSEATKQGLVFKEVSDIYFNNYNNLCSLTREESEKMCGDIYCENYQDIPIKLAKKLRNFKPYFDYDEYQKYHPADFILYEKIRRLIRKFIPWSH